MVKIKKVKEGKEGKKGKNIGISASEPQKTCTDSTCPWHGNLKIRGRIFKGKIMSAKAAKTVIVGWNYYRFVPKYERYERRKSRLAAHLPECIDVKQDDDVIIGECRPISKSKSFVVIERLKE